MSTEIIRPLVLGKTLLKAYPSHTGRYAKETVKGLDKLSQYSDLEVTSVANRGKFMYWTFDEPFFALFATFGMSGQYSDKPGKHVAFTFEFTDNTKIYFNDPRHFGTISFTDSYDKLKEKLNSFGWEPLQDDLNKWLPFLYRKFDSDRTVAELLMDQSIQNGTGNYGKVEALYKSKISPWRKGNSLTKEEVKMLCENVAEIYKESYAHQGVTISTYKDPYGNEGKYSSNFKVYSKKFDPLGNKIIRETTLDKRTTHWCPAIQK